MTVFTLNIHHKGGRGREIPPPIKRIFFGFFAKILFVHLDVDQPEASAPSRKGMVSGRKGLVGSLCPFLNTFLTE